VAAWWLDYLAMMLVFSAVAFTGAFALLLISLIVSPRRIHILWMTLLYVYLLSTWAFALVLFWRWLLPWGRRKRQTWGKRVAGV